MQTQSKTESVATYQTQSRNEIMYDISFLNEQASKLNKECSAEWLLMKKYQSQKRHFEVERCRRYNIERHNIS